MEQLKKILEELAIKKAHTDNPEFMVYDWAGGNIDDAYQLGYDDGEICLARTVLKLLNETDRKIS
jgi:hypothetical protein